MNVENEKYFDEYAALKQLFSALEYGKKKEELRITSKIFSKYNLERLSTNQLCNAILNNGPGFENFFLEVMNELRPFAIMVQDIYRFLSYFKTTMEKKATLFRVTGEKARQTFDFDMENFPKDLVRILSETTTFCSIIILKYGYDVENIPNFLKNRNFSTAALWDEINPRWDGDFYDDGFHRVLSYAGNFINEANEDFCTRVNDLIIPIIECLIALTQPIIWEEFAQSSEATKKISVYMNGDHEELERHIFEPISYQLDKKKAVMYFTTEIGVRFNSLQESIYNEIHWTLEGLAVSIALWKKGSPRQDRGKWLSNQINKPFEDINQEDYFNLLQSVSTKYRSSLDRLIITEKRSVKKLHEQLLEFLNLPFWKNRWFLYELWTLSFVLNTAKDEWPVRLLQLNAHPNGLLNWNLPGANSKNPVANIGENAEIECWIQRKSYHPETRKGLEPDLRLSKNNPNRQDLIIIENKDRRKPRKSEMSEILKRYVTGTNAKLVCLINYDQFTEPTHNLSEIFQDREVQIYSEFKPLLVPKRFIDAFKEIVRNEIRISNSSLEISFPGKDRNYSENINKNSRNIIATLNWSKGPTDLDLHSWVKRDGDKFHISYKNLGVMEDNPFAQLDTDAQTLPGKETIYVNTDSLYSVNFAVHLYSEGSFSSSDASLMITYNNRTLIFKLPEANTGNWWHICTINENTKELIVLQKVDYNSPN